MTRMQIDRNITKYQGRNVSYKVCVMRDNRTIVETHLSLQDAIKARNEIERIWQNEKQLKHSSLFQPGHLQRAKERYDNEEVEVGCYGGQVRYIAKCKCSKCGRTSKFSKVLNYRNFVDRGRLCRSCLVVETVNERVSARNKNSNANSSNRSTGIKNISYDPCRCRYLINVRRNKQSFSERSKSLQEAIRIKDRVLEFYDNFNRLPRQNEI